MKFLDFSEKNMGIHYFGVVDLLTKMFGSQWEVIILVECRKALTGHQ